MQDNQTHEYSRFWRWRYAQGEDAGDQLQQAIQAYINRYQKRPFLVLIPAGLNLLPPMDGLDVQQNETVPPFRFYFAVPQAEDDAQEPAK